jgi:hypothetical protein
VINHHAKSNNPLTPFGKGESRLKPNITKFSKKPEAEAVRLREQRLFESIREFNEKGILKPATDFKMP